MQTPFQPFHAATRAQRPPSSAPSRLPGVPFPVSVQTWRVVRLVPMNPELGCSALDIGPLRKHAKPHSSTVTTPGAEAWAGAEKWVLVTVLVIAQPNRETQRDPRVRL